MFRRMEIIAVNKLSQKNNVAILCLLKTYHYLKRPLKYSFPGHLNTL